MQNKPAKYGINPLKAELNPICHLLALLGGTTIVVLSRLRVKVFCLVDSRMFYTSQMEIYPGKQPEGSYKLSNSPSDVVKRLIQPISHRGRKKTFDNWFTSVTLAEEILKEHKITIFGTIRKNKKEIPSEFINTKEREEKIQKVHIQRRNNCIIYSSLLIN